LRSISPFTVILHPPLEHPEAKKIIHELYETFGGLPIKGWSSVSEIEESFRSDFHISVQIAYWLKARQVFSRVIRGHWNDVGYKIWILQGIASVYAQDMDFWAQQPRDAKPIFEQLVKLLKSKPTVEDIQARIKPFLPPDIEWTRENKAKYLGKSFDLPENPDVDRFLQSVRNELTVPAIPREELRQKVRASYAKLHPGASKNLDKKFLDELCVNHLRHEHTTYDTELERFLGKLDVADQAKCHAALKALVLDKISETNPYSEDECNRQKAALSK
jgi:hypothetical protein